MFVSWQKWFDPTFQILIHNIMFWPQLIVLHSLLPYIFDSFHLLVPNRTGRREVNEIGHLCHYLNLMLSNCLFCIIIITHTFEILCKANSDNNAINHLFCVHILIIIITHTLERLYKANSDNNAIKIFCFMYK